MDQRAESGHLLGAAFSRARWHVGFLIPFQQGSSVIQIRNSGKSGAEIAHIILIEFSGLGHLNGPRELPKLVHTALTELVFEPVLSPICRVSD
jgi:hypothetical protein